MKQGVQTGLVLTAIVLAVVATVINWLDYKLRNDPRWMARDILIEKFDEPRYSFTITFDPNSGEGSRAVNWSMTDSSVFDALLRKMANEDAELFNSFLRHDKGSIRLAGLLILRDARPTAITPAVLDVLRKECLTHADPKVRSVALDVLRLRGMTIADFVTTLSDPEPVIRRSSANAIASGRVSPGNDEEWHRMISALLDHLTDPDPYVRGISNTEMRQHLFVRVPVGMRQNVLDVLLAPTEEARKEAQKKVIEWWIENGEKIVR